MKQFLNHRGYPVPSPACLQQIGDGFRRRVASFAEANHIPVVTLKAADRNIEVMRPYLDAAAATGRSQVAAVGVAQETQRVFISRKRDTAPGRCPQFSFDKKDRRVTVYYFTAAEKSFASSTVAAGRSLGTRAGMSLAEGGGTPARSLGRPSPGSRCGAGRFPGGRPSRASPARRAALTTPDERPAAQQCTGQS